MVMSDAPSTAAFCNKHGEARWTCYRLAFHHPGERVEAEDYDGVVVDYYRAPFVNRILIAGSFCRGEILYDRFGPLGHDRADGSEQDGIRPVVLGDGFWV